MNNPGFLFHFLVSISFIIIVITFVSMIPLLIKFVQVFYSVIRENIKTARLIAVP